MYMCGALILQVVKEKSAKTPYIIYLFRMDALFLAYTVDLDTDQVHCTDAHEAFAKKWLEGGAGFDDNDVSNDDAYNEGVGMENVTDEYASTLLPSTSQRRR